MKTKLGVVVLVVFAVLTVSAQKILPCGTTEMYNKAIKENPRLLLQQAKLEKFTEDYISNSASARTTATPTTYLIPIVFHIIHNYGPENISDAQVYSEMTQLNLDYSKQNSDTSKIATKHFAAIAANCHFVFRLAQRDPDGNCTNGIDRVASTLTYNGSDNSKLNQWPPSKYLNVWVVASLANNVAGYSYLPGALPSSKVDGVIMLSSYVGNIGTGNPETSRCLTHEIGHYLNLYHPWGATNAPGVSCGVSPGDYVADTPVTKGYDFCPADTNAAIICSPPIVENYQNFMEYSYCSVMFTNDQAARMQAALNSSTASRNNLWTTANQTAIGISTNATVNDLCTADFIANKTVLCEGYTATFTDNSWNGPTSWNWTFPGGSPATANTSVVNVTYPSEGTYDVSLTASNGVSSPSVTKSGFITVYNTAADFNAPFTEGFESEAIPNTTWTVNNVTPENPYTWTTTTPGYGSNTCVFINNFKSDTASSSQLISSTINLTTIKNPKLYYRVAYAQVNSGSQDNLSIYLSPSCGESWTSSRESKSGSNLASVSPTTSAFYPNSPSQWRLDSLNLIAFANLKNVRIMFQFTNGSGNNIYIDDINISSNNNITGIENLVSNTIDFAVYPNPVEDKSTITFNLMSSAKVSVRIYDILGKEVMDLAEGQNLPTGSYKYDFNSNGLSPSIYFVKLMVDDQQFVQKVIVK